jgi:hypothetical protein
MGGACSIFGVRNAYKMWLEYKRPLGKPRHRWKDNIKINLMAIGWEDVDWIHLA